MFDTHQAARLLNLGRHSLDHLLKLYCSVESNKQYQLADWRIRLVCTWQEVWVAERGLGSPNLLPGRACSGCCFISNEYIRLLLGVFCDTKGTEKFRMEMWSLYQVDCCTLLLGSSSEKKACLVSIDLCQSPFFLQLCCL